MHISLKNKLFIGFGFLFFMIVLLWVIGGIFIHDLSNRSAAMLKENYQTVESTKYLIESLDEIKNKQTRFFFSEKHTWNDSLYNLNKKSFEEHLIAVQNNITEMGEGEIISGLKESYSLYIRTYEQFIMEEHVETSNYFNLLIPEYTQTRNIIISLWDMNMDAISYKNTLLKSTAYRAFVLMSIIGTICFGISALFFFKYPKNISRPIIELIKGIREIADRNYSQRLDFQSNDELGELATAFNAMAAKLDEYEHSNLSQLLFEKKRIDTIINVMKDAIIGLDDKNEIIFSNTYACRIFNLDEDLVTGKKADDIARQNPVFKSILGDILYNQEEDIKEFKPLRLMIDDKVRYFTREILDVSITDIGGHKLTKVGIVVILKNITRFLEQDEAKTNFIATISHELKTPISSLRLNLKLLEDYRVGDLNTEQKDIVDALKLETNKMLTITSELLDLAQVETGNIQMNLQPVKVEKLLDYIKETSFEHAKAKSIDIKYSLGSDLPVVYADSEKTAWVLINLINNAIQYSEPGSSVLINVSSERNNVVFMIQDYGKGIEKKYLELVFQKFFRVPGSGEKGTGLGLAISKEFITKQNGRIWAESNPGEGSCFYFSLPVFKT
ncbi:MAG: HAMP domain-containing protein [Bacteroidales bacterium]|nr:HAMP domain-containing protein [Bacteroidales bacterium]